MVGLTQFLPVVFVSPHYLLDYLPVQLNLPLTKISPSNKTVDVVSISFS